MAEQKGQKSRAQATRKGSSSRDVQASRKNSSSRGGQATATAGRSAGGGSANGKGAARMQATRQGAAGRPPGQGAGRPAKAPDGRRVPADVSVAQGPWTPRWVSIAALLLSVIGMGLGIYLTIAHLAGTQVLACSNKGFIDCAAVTTSPESEVFGIFPVAELGLGFYVVMTLLNLPGAWRPIWSWLPERLKTNGLESKLPVWAWRLRLAGIIVGIVFILYLIYTELITLRQICLFCTYTHIATFLLFVLLIVQAAFWGDPSKAPESAAQQASR